MQAIRTRAWKVHGPDANGAYGGLQGIGGLESVYIHSMIETIPGMNYALPLGGGGFASWMLELCDVSHETRFANSSADWYIKNHLP